MEQARITSHQGAQGHHSVRGKASAHGATPANSASPDAATAGDFMSVLATLDDGLLADPLAPSDGGLVVGTDGAAQDATDAAALAALQGGFLPWQLPAAAGQGGGTVALAAGADGLLGGNGGPAFGRTGALHARGDGPLAMASALGGELLPQGTGLVAQTAFMDAASDAGAGLQGGQAASPGGHRRAFPRMQAAIAQGGDALAAVPAVGNRAMVKDMTGAAALSASPELQPAAARRDMVATIAQTLERAEQDPAATVAPLALAGVDEASGGRAVARSGDAGRAGGSDASGSWGPGNASHETQAALPLEGGSPFADLAAAGAEDAVAEQVAYWVSQNIQNAELTVSHEGNPVEVSVSLTGNDAHVAFRSDQTQTRDLLDASVGQLREMLRNEGLILTGVTVGGSGGQGGRPDEGGGRGGQSGARHAQVVAPVAIGARSGKTVLTDRAVDIFV